jgi:hypothetical protein
MCHSRTEPSLRQRSYRPYKHLFIVDLKTWVVSALDNGCKNQGKIDITTPDGFVVYLEFQRSSPTCLSVCLFLLINLYKAYSDG